MLNERRRHLPLIPKAASGLPLAQEVRDIDRQCAPRYAVWELTLRCDLACRHCGSRAGKARPDELSTAEAVGLMDQLADMGTEEVTLIGGEAYLHTGWLDVIRAGAERGMEVNMVSGGRGITPQLAKDAYAAGIRRMSISIDGFKPLHDRLRGLDGAFDSAVAALENLRSAGIHTASNAQLTRYSLTQFEDVFGFLLDKGIGAWQVAMTVPMGRAADEPQILLQPYQVLEVLALVARIARRAQEAGVALSPGNDIGYFGPYEALLRAEHPGKMRPACTAGSQTIGIEANGAIKGCPSLPSKDYVGGNIREHSLEDIWQRAEPLRFTRKRPLGELWGHCAICYYADACYGGCSWTAHTFFGKRGNNPYCHHRAIELLKQGLRERVVMAEPSPGVPFDFGRFELIEEPWPDADLAQAQAIVAEEAHFLPETLKLQAL